MFSKINSLWQKVTQPSQSDVKDVIGLSRSVIGSFNYQYENFEGTNANSDLSVYKKALDIEELKESIFCLMQNEPDSPLLREAIRNIQGDGLEIFENEGEFKGALASFASHGSMTISM